MHSGTSNRVADGMERLAENAYQPALKFAIAHRWTVMCLFATMGLLMAGYCMGGRLGFSPSQALIPLALQPSGPWRCPPETTIDTSGESSMP